MIKNKQRGNVNSGHYNKNFMCPADICRKATHIINNRYI